MALIGFCPSNLTASPHSRTAVGQTTLNFYDSIQFDDIRGIRWTFSNCLPATGCIAGTKCAFSNYHHCPSSPNPSINEIPLIIRTVLSCKNPRVQSSAWVKSQLRCMPTTTIISRSLRNKSSWLFQPSGSCRSDSSTEKYVSLMYPLRAFQIIMHPPEVTSLSSSISRIFL